MKLLIVLAVVVMVSARPDGEHYDSKFDKINVPEILNNDRLLNSYLNCLLEVAGAKCTAEGKELKVIVPDAINSKCMKCSPEQKKNVHDFLKGLEEKDPTKYNALKVKYDPDNKHQKELDEFFEQY